jgi:hypothetical protein
MEIPKGISTCLFVGRDDYVMAGCEKWFWKFEIAGGPYAGQIVGKASSRKPSPTNICGELITALTKAVDGEATPFVEFCPVFYEGSKVRVMVVDGALIEVMPARIIPVRLYGYAR